MQVHDHFIQCYTLRPAGKQTFPICLPLKFDVIFNAAAGFLIFPPALLYIKLATSSREASAFMAYSALVQCSEDIGYGKEMCL